MSEFLKQRVAHGHVDPHTVDSSHSASNQPWYDEVSQDDVNSASLNVPQPGSTDAKHSLALNLSPAKPKKLIDELSQLEQDMFRSGLPTAMNMAESPSLSVDRDGALNDINHTIDEIERILMQKQAEPIPSPPTACESCGALQSENASLKVQMDSMGKELVSLRAQISSTKSPKASSSTAHGFMSPTSPLTAASIRLKSVTAALNKALQSKK